MKYKYLVNLLFFIFLFSCSSIKIKEQKNDCPTLYGHVKRIEAVSQLYSLGKNAEPSSKINSNIFYDKINRIIKQFDCYNTINCDSTIFKYDNNSGLLVNILNSKIKNHETLKVVYRYDTNGNEIERNEYQNDTLYYNSFNEYDKYNNQIKSTRLDKKNVTTNRYDYNYKKRYYTVKSFKNGSNNPTYTIISYYNKKGYITKEEKLNKDSNFTLFCTFEYDYYNNLSKQVFYDDNNKATSTNKFTRIFDKKGNMISKESYQNEKLYEKNTYNITYW